jgi:hypothetical protein
VLSRLKGRIPARSKLEAVSRISALTNAPAERLGPGSKERKSVLVNLAVGLSLPADNSAAKPELARQICGQFGVAWDASCWSAGQTITLEGLNRVLLGAEAYIARQHSAPQLELFESVQPANADFVPARSKLEAVTRVSALTGSPPETLGPGSKERRSAIANLGSGLGLAVDPNANKPALGEQICGELGETWDESCWSAGQTITLVGLNRLLEGAERRLSSRQSQPGFFFSAKEEAVALLSALRDVLPEHMDGRSCVQQMHAAEYSQWAQDEWAGFYFEFVGLPSLINTFGGGPREFGKTRFDYGLGHTWDLKVHMAASGIAPLNDQGSMQAAAEGGGVGFLVLTGEVEYDDGDFRQWQRDFRAAHGKPAKAHTTPKTYERKSKTAFKPFMVEAFYLPDRAAIDSAVGRGILKIMKQGRQTSGQERQPKYALDLVKARLSDVILGQTVLGL